MLPWATKNKTAAATATRNKTLKMGALQLCIIPANIVEVS